MDIHLEGEFAIAGVDQARFMGDVSETIKYLQEVKEYAEQRGYFVELDQDVDFVHFVFTTPAYREKTNRYRAEKGLDLLWRANSRESGMRNRNG